MRMATSYSSPASVPLIHISTGRGLEDDLRSAVKGDVRQMRRRLIGATLLAPWACVLRIWVFALLPFRWDDHAFGSMVWSILGVQ